MMHGSRGHNILLVDDEEMFLSSLFDGLRRRFPDFTFRTANNGEMALDQLGKQSADLVITDLKMPKMDGFQLIAAMHSQYPAIPLLIMTAHSTELSEGKAMASGALHCIDKPVDLAELSRRIDELFSTGAIASLRGVSLAAFLQLLGLEKKSGIVDVQGEGVRARLYLSNGQVIHADNGNYSGLQAALRTVGLDDVEIHFRPGAVPKTPTIDLPLTQLLLDSARMRDEGERDAIQDLDLAFSESFSDAFDEQLERLGDDDKDKAIAVSEAQIEEVAEEKADEPSEAAPIAATATTAAAVEEPPAGQPAVSGDIAAARADSAAPTPIGAEPSIDVNWDAVPEPSGETAQGTRPNGDSAAIIVSPKPVDLAADLAAAPNDKANDVVPKPIDKEQSSAVRAPLRDLASRPVAAPLRAAEASGAVVSGIIASPISTPNTSRASTVLPIPRPSTALPAAARASVLTPPTGRPAMPRPSTSSGAGPAATSNARPRTATPSVPTYSAEANVSDAVASCLRKIGEIGGVLGAAFIDFQSGETLGSITRESGFDTVATARANIDMVRAKLALIEALGLQDVVEDIIITTRRQYHVLCMSPRRPRQFVFVGLARDQATLALARFLIDEAIQNASPGGIAS